MPAANIDYMEALRIGRTVFEGERYADEAESYFGLRLAKLDPSKSYGPPYFRRMARWCLQEAYRANRRHDHETYGHFGDADKDEVILARDQEEESKWDDWAEEFNALSAKLTDDKQRCLSLRATGAKMTDREHMVCIRAIRELRKGVAK